MVRISLFAQFKMYQGDRELIVVLNEIREGKYASPVCLLREYLAKGDKVDAEQLKKRLLAFTVSSSYQGVRKREHLTAYHPLLILDLDKLPQSEIPRLRQLIEQAPYTVACFLSPSGNGLKVIVYAAVEIPSCVENHRLIYDRMRIWYEWLLGVKIDASGSDAGRLCFVSYDPDLYLSPRFKGWLQGDEPLPTDLESVAHCEPEESAADEGGIEFSPDVKERLSLARKRTSRKFRYVEGNRNNYVFQFACHCNRLGVPKRSVQLYGQRCFKGLVVEELFQAIESAYLHIEERGKELIEKGVSREQLVQSIQRYLGKNYQLRYNVVRRFVEWRRKDEDKPFLPVTDYWENSVWCALQRVGVPCKLSDLHAVVHSDFSQEFDPFVAYFSGLPEWDGVTDHIARLAETVVTERPEFWLSCLRKWLVATVACAIDKQPENHTILLLSGEQGIGKTSWCRHLVPPALASYVYSGNLDPSSKDALLLLCDCFLIILDELSGQSRMELNRLKAMITKDVVRERRAYARNAETYVRRASFLATVNDNQVLTDRTGSRRFLCFEAKQIDYMAPVDYEGIYSQALALYRSGFKYWFSDRDIVEVNENNESFQQNSPEEELFYTYFRFPNDSEKPQYLSSSEIMSKICVGSRLSMTHGNVNNLGKMLKRAGFKQVRRGGRRYFAVVELTFDERKANQQGVGEELCATCAT